MGEVAAASLGNLPTPPHQLAKANANYKFVVFSAVRPEPVAEGDEVFVVLRSNKNTGRARALGGVIQDPSHPHVGRIPVLYHDNQATYHVRPARVNKVVTGERIVIICGDTDNYRHLARCQVSPHHFVIDLGSSYGVSTHILSQHCRRVIGVDVARDLVESARTSYPHVPFECMDILQNPARISELARGCDSVFIDIGGDRQLAQVVPTVEFVKRQLAPATIVVKSRELLKAAVTCIKGHCRQTDAGGEVEPPVTDASSNHVDGAGTTRLGHWSGLAGLRSATSAVDVPGDEVWWDQLFAHITGLGSDPTVNASSSSVTTNGSTGASSSNPAVAAGDVVASGSLTVTGNDPTVTKDGDPTQEGTGLTQEYALPKYDLPKPRYPLYYPTRYAANGVKICRFHNYRTCLEGDKCEFDHVHCHRCGKPGHTALMCDSRKTCTVLGS